MHHANDAKVTPTKLSSGIDSKFGGIFDVCVIGGGITGAAIARDAALRGLKVILIEKGDFAQGTSSRSSKLVHGGIRYLENFEFGLVAESTRERARLWKLAPELVKPLGFIFPAYNFSRLPLWKLDIGVWLYDLLSLFRSPGLHKLFFKKKTLDIEPALRSEGLKGSVFYWDAATDDGLLTLANIIDAEAAGAKCLSYTKVDSIQWSWDCSENPNAFHLVRIHLTIDTDIKPPSLSGLPDQEIRARTVVCATGPWTDETLGILKKHDSDLQKMAPTRGSHIVVSSKKLPLNNAIVLTHPQDGRVLFGIPWGGATVIGTTDIFDRESPDETRISPDEIRYLLNAAEAFFPNNPLKGTDILSAWSGLRPLLAPAGEASASQISREHLIEWHKPGLLVIAGGKLTTHREMAEQAVDRILGETQNWEVALFAGTRPCQTHTRPLPKILGPLPHIPVCVEDLTPEALKHLCKNLHIITLTDLMVRRTEIFYKDEQNGLAKISFKADVICEQMSWTKAQWDKELKDYQNYVDFNFRNPLKSFLESKPLA